MAHQTLLGPESIERRPGSVRIGPNARETLWIGEFPDRPVDGYLETLYTTGKASATDVSIHIAPRDTQPTLDALENRIEDLQAEYE
ncbi:MAG: transfer complex protein, partial [Salinirussus sp.]